jgi:hypothetical protein
MLPSSGSVACQKMRPATKRMTKKGVPMIDVSSHRARTLGTGTGEPCSAERDAVLTLDGVR